MRINLLSHSQLVTTLLPNVVEMKIERRLEFKVN